MGRIAATTRKIVPSSVLCKAVIRVFPRSVTALNLLAGISIPCSPCRIMEGDIHSEYSPLASELVQPRKRTRQIAVEQ
jgi:hypothetical protein